MNSGDLSKKNEYTVVDKNSSKMNVTIEQQLFHRQQMVDELQVCHHLKLALSRSLPSNYLNV